MPVNTESRWTKLVHGDRRGHSWPHAHYYEFIGGEWLVACKSIRTPQGMRPNREYEIVNGIIRLVMDNAIKDKCPKCIRAIASRRPSSQGD